MESTGVSAITFVTHSVRLSVFTLPTLLYLSTSLSKLTELVFLLIIGTIDDCAVWSPGHSRTEAEVIHVIHKVKRIAVSQADRLFKRITSHQFPNDDRMMIATELLTPLGFLKGGLVV
jgi:hypothetical protein